MLDPNENKAAYTKYFSEALGFETSIQRSEALKKSTRQAPWRFDLEINGKVKAFVLRIDARSSLYEYQVLKAMEEIPIPTPKVYGLDEEGQHLGEPCFFMELIKGESLLTYMKAGEGWADDLYISTANRLHAVQLGQLGEVAKLIKTETAEDVLDSAYEYLHSLDEPVAEAAYKKLKGNVPTLAQTCFSNGDLYPDNMLVKDKTLVAVIDFANASVSDPLYEFLLTFFVHPELRGRGIEENFCESKGIDSKVLPWYHALEYFDTWRWVSKYGEPFVGYDEDRLRSTMQKWVETGSLD
ncbi:MAG: hypothetical protein DWQ07_19980 [Chloroflexi bacterium]|nr:MAG: hypothetical protein DWQ07_19980 [Chloroflexota bacterium]MBL1194363.1 hypothetical protein [Chloroflexota bacterium]NOH11651.1 phosphotransferase [Chloroflexota bacterium]